MNLEVAVGHQDPLSLRRGPVEYISRWCNNFLRIPALDIVLSNRVRAIKPSPTLVVSSRAAELRA
ncbi:MAG: hypothetical protein GWP69_22095, partial [Gammaproteobacteria bacterium]|nr:hypothetical protein [Gammaproteobacteria bacterium]